MPNHVIRKSVRDAAMLIAALGALMLAAQNAAAAVTVPSPSIDARSYVLYDHASQQVLAEKEGDARVEPASITKIMTVYVVAHAIRSGLVALTDEVVISEKAWRMEGSRMFIEVGKKVSVDALLDGVIVQSGNDASVALAEHVSGTEDTFAVVMNDHAKRLGMTNSSFANATGLPDPNLYVTARDVVILSSALVREFPDIYARFARREFTYNEIRQPNRNRLLARDSSVDGIKTGHTENAGYCLVSSATRDGMRLIAAVMGTASDRARTEASQKLLNFGYRFYESRRVYGPDDVVMTPRVWRGAAESVQVGPMAEVHLTIPRGSYDQLDAVAEVDGHVMAPVAAGQVVGSATISLDGKVLAKIPLKALGAVEEGPFYSRLYDDFMMLFE